MTVRFFPGGPVARPALLVDWWICPGVRAGFQVAEALRGSGARFDEILPIEVG